MKLAPDSLKLEIVEIGGLPLYNQDLDDNPPAAWIEFRERLKKYDGVLFVTPEYNRSVPGGLKNALDVGSRPYGKSVWDGKPCAVVSVSPGAIGGFGANHHLRQSLVFLNMPVLQQPEAYMGNAANLFDESGNLVNESARESAVNLCTRLRRGLQSYIQYKAMTTGKRWNGKIENNEMENHFFHCPCAYPGYRRNRCIYSHEPRLHREGRDREIRLPGNDNCCSSVLG